jgi:hypothetical protein
MTDTAWVVHRTVGRLRLRLPERKGNAAFFADLAAAIAALPGALSVRQSLPAASLVIEHDPDSGESFEPALEGLGLVLVEGEPPSAPPLETLSAGFAGIERALREASGNAADLRTLGFIVLATAGLVQVARGHAFSAGSSLLWHAADLLREARR